MSILNWFLTPSPTINYNFVAGMYTLFSALSVLLFILTYFTSAVDGFYIVLLPFWPCLAWSLVVRQRWLADNNNQENDKQQEEESKKDK